MSDPHPPPEKLPEPATEPTAREADAASVPAADASALPDRPNGPGRRRRRRRRRGGGRRDERHPAGLGLDAEGPSEAGEPETAGPETVVAEEPEKQAEPAPEPAADVERPSAAAVRDDGQPADIDPARLDPDGLKILNRLHRHGHQAYFVGGCVRDVLLGLAPKDYDIATSAHPGEVRSLFRNCRLIGRRFRLAHVYFRGGKIIEVSTFRANPTEAVEDGEAPPEDLLITRDNVFGTAEQDALRRDFTVNGLFYDIRLGRVIDFAQGLPDLRASTLRTIGDPEIRMREDPVRILRAVRFASRLGFEIDPVTYAAMEGAVEDLPRCSPPRLLEEVFKLLRGGHSSRSFQLLHALGALELLLPPVAGWLRASGPRGAGDLWKMLAALDARMHRAPVDDALIISVLLHPLTLEVSPDPDNEYAPIAAVDALLEQMVQTARLPRRLAERARTLLWAEGVLSGRRKRRRSLASFRRHPIFPDALTLFEVVAEGTGEGRDLVATWKEGKTPESIRPPPKGPGAEAAPGEGGGRRRRRRRRRRRGEPSSVPPAPEGAPA